MQFFSKVNALLIWKKRHREQSFRCNDCTIPHFAVSSSNIFKQWETYKCFLGWIISVEMNLTSWDVSTNYFERKKRNGNDKQSSSLIKDVCLGGGWGGRHSVHVKRAHFSVLLLLHVRGLLLDSDSHAFGKMFWIFLECNAWVLSGPKWLYQPSDTREVKKFLISVCFHGTHILNCVDYK